jgi:N,N'-diacetylchitobiose transport system permease protein
VSRRARSGLLNAIALVAALLFAFPVYWMVITAFKRAGDIQTYVPVFLPLPTLDNFVKAIGQDHFTDFLRNSLLVTGVTLVLALLVGFLTAATLARGRVRGRRGFLLLVAMAQMAPFEALLIPFFLVVRDIGLYNRLPSLVLVYFTTLPFTICRCGRVPSIPVDLEEAAARRRDPSARSCGVTLPLLRRFVATSIFCFITAWSGTLRSCS